MLKWGRVSLSGRPPSNNHIYKPNGFGGIYLTKEGKALKEMYRWEYRVAYKGAPMTGPIRIKVAYIFEDNRTRDYDNYTKLWQDAATGIIWKDDKQIFDARVFKLVDKNNPRIEVFYEELERVPGIDDIDFLRTLPHDVAEADNL